VPFDGGGQRQCLVFRPAIGPEGSPAI